MFPVHLGGKGRFSIDFVLQAVHVHAFCFGLQAAHEPFDLEVLVVVLK